jgi:outer membrane protein OmpA-like peptidoglycan-associated protein
MRRALALALLFPTLAAPAFADPSGISPTPAVPLDGKKGPKLQVTIDQSKVDLSGHRLEVQLSHAADKVRIKVIGVSGGVLAEVEKSFGGASPGTVLAMSWTPSRDEEVGRIEVYGYDTDGFWIGVAITPWHASVDHEDVNFDTDQDVIKAGEAPKLQATLKKIAELMGQNPTGGVPTLYVIGHTDTVGSNDHNVTLSRGRARSIAAWFAAHGLKIPVSYEGIGKAGLLVKTADQVDEARNRRAEYILAMNPPSLPPGDFSFKTP